LSVAYLKHSGLQVRKIVRRPTKRPTVYNVKTLNRLTASIALSALLLTACGGESGFTQEQVDAMVSDAVQSAVADAESELVSEAEAQAKAEEAAK